MAEAHSLAMHNPRILITRPIADADALKPLLMQMGFDTVCEPMLHIVPLKDAEEHYRVACSNHWQAALVTSKNALPVMAAISAERALPLLAVGQTTAEIALKCGFTTCAYAGGNITSLIAMLEKYYSPALGKLLYLSGKDTATDLPNILSEKGFTVTQLMLYEAQATEHIADETVQLIRQKAIDGVLFFSMRTAMIFHQLAAENGIEEALPYCEAFCLSPAIAVVLRGKGWKKIHISEEPNQKSLLLKLRERFFNERI